MASLEKTVVSHDKTIMEIAKKIKVCDDTESFEHFSSVLMEWASDVIKTV